MNCLSSSEFQKKLFVYEAEMIAKNMLELILSGIRTPERPGTPQNAYLTEEDVFRERNPTVNCLCLRSSFDDLDT